MTFDGSDVGVGKSRVEAAAWLDAYSNSGPVDDSNTAGTFSLYFDGSDVGLTVPRPTSLRSSTCPTGDSS